MGVVFTRGTEKGIITLRDTLAYFALEKNSYCLYVKTSVIIILCKLREFSYDIPFFQVTPFKKNGDLFTY